MTARVEFFADGPLAGWNKVRDAIGSPVVFVLPEDQRLYLRRRWMFRGWLVAIPIWSIDGVLAPGVALPGLVLGEDLECCRMRR